MILCVTRVTQGSNTIFFQKIDYKFCRFHIISLGKTRLEKLDYDAVLKQALQINLQMYVFAIFSVDGNIPFHPKRYLVNRVLKYYMNGTIECQLIIESCKYTKGMYVFNCIFCTLSKNIQLQVIFLVADPGSGQWGAKHFSRDFADKAKRANIGWGPGPALGPWKLLHF